MPVLSSTGPMTHPYELVLRVPLEQQTPAEELPEGVLAEEVFQSDIHPNTGAVLQHNGTAVAVGVGDALGAHAAAYTPETAREIAFGLLDMAEAVELHQQALVQQSLVQQAHINLLAAILNPEPDDQPELPFDDDLGFDDAPYDDEPCRYCDYSFDEDPFDDDPYDTDDDTVIRSTN